MEDRTRTGGEPPRRPYHRPDLIEYGPIAQLTQGSVTVGNDGLGNTMMK